MGGGIIFTLGRTPKAKESYEFISKKPEFVENNKTTQKKLDNIIIKTICDFNSFYGTGGMQTIDLYLSGYTWKDVEKEQNEILNTKVKDIKGYALALKRVLKEKKYFVQGNKTMLEQSGIIFIEEIDVEQIK